MLILRILKKVIIKSIIIFAVIFISISNSYSNLNSLTCENIDTKKSLIPKHINKLDVDYEPNFESALNWCDVASMLRIQNERMNQSYFPSIREYAKEFGLDKKKLLKLNKEITNKFDK